MNQRDLFRKKIEEKKEKASKKPRYGMRKLSVGFVSCLVGFVMFLTGVPVMAEGGQSRSVNNEVHYTLAGETDGVLDYARTDYTKEDSDGIHLTVTKWAKLPGTWGYTERGPYNGRYLLNFFEDDFYTQIESIKVNNTEFEKEANGALWKVPIENATLHSGGIGAITNDDIVIKLKSGASLTSLGLADKKINFTTTWVRNDAKADTGGYDNGYILKNNTNVPTLPSNPSNGNEYYLGTGLNGLTNDGTKSKDGNFTSGNTGKVVSYDAKEKAIRSTVSFKPDQNFLQANSGWVLYINEVIPKELLKYIDTNNVRLGVSTSRGKITANEPIKLTVDPNGNGHISTKDTPELSIEGGDWDRVTKVRSTLDSQVFYGALGQRRSYTIEYKLKSDVSNQEFAKALNEYITTNNSQLNFESWLTADFVDSTNAFPGIRKPDGGKPNKILQNSYANAFMEVLDTDKDGLYDFLEDEIDSDKFKVDTDGDGVPDGQEVLADKTDPKNAKSYLVVKPDVTTKTIEANSTQTIVGKVPKTIYDNPADTSKKLAATNPDAGNVIVKAYKYVADNTDYTTQPVKAQTTIPFADLTDGNFTVNVPAGTFAEGDKVILVAYSPDGNNPKVSSTTVRVGAIKVTFDTNGGKWSDGTNADKIVNAVNGAATQPEEPTRDGYQFLGWASTDNATVAEAGILDNVSEDKEVFAVWKDNKAPVIGNIGDQTVVERNAITEINVTTDDPTATVTVKDLPSGLTYSNGKISGTPSVTSWGNDEKKEFTVTVEAKDPSGNTSTKTFKIIVHRDTDRDGTPDITDTDDDGDGVPDTVEIAKGSDPKNPNSRPMGTVTPVSPTTISNPTQTLIDENAITNIVITPGNTASTVTVDTSKLPNGVTYDPTTKTISGTPDVTNWGPSEETRKFEVPVVVTNPDGSKTTKTVEIVVQRDTDKDGNPDVTDPDDDNDGVTDVEENAKGTNPKDPNSKPTNTSTQTNNQGSGKKIDTGRIAGKDRIDTAIDISKKLYKKSKAVIIVRSDIFPDSMTASVLARLKDAPILLNPTGQLDSRVAAEIKRLGATEIIIVGGADSISARVRDELRAYDSDNDVERIGGKDRYETSELVARKVISITGNKNTAVVASGQVFPDALTVGTFASRDGYPILLVKKDIVPSQIERVIKDLDIDKVYIAGGTDTISKRVEAKLPRVIERMAGRDRYETSVAIARSKFKDSKEAFVASGQQFADALVISPVSGKYNLPTLLVSTNASSNQEVKRYIQQSKINKLIAVGGERYLPSSIIDNLIK